MSAACLYGFNIFKDGRLVFLKNLLEAPKVDLVGPLNVSQLRREALHDDFNRRLVVLLDSEFHRPT